MHTYNFVGLIRRLDLDQCTLRFGNLEYASIVFALRDKGLLSVAKEAMYKDALVHVTCCVEEGIPTWFVTGLVLADSGSS